MSPAIRKERITTGTMEPLLHGGYREREYTGYAWMCPGCGLVWEKRHLAEGCESRGHKPSFTQTYGVRGIVNGQPVGNIYHIERRAIRRDSVAK